MVQFLLVPTALTSREPLTESKCCCVQSTLSALNDLEILFWSPESKWKYSWRCCVTACPWWRDAPGFNSCGTATSWCLGRAAARQRLLAAALCPPAVPWDYRESFYASGEFKLHYYSQTKGLEKCEMLQSQTRDGHTTNYDITCLIKRGYAVCFR